MYQQLHSDSGGLPGGRYRDTKLEYLPDGRTFGPWPDGNRRRVDVDAAEDPANRYEIINGRDLPVREHSVTGNTPRRGAHMSISIMGSACSYDACGINRPF